MAMNARAGRYHIDIDQRTCIDCAGCVSICPTRALDMHLLDLACRDDDCIGCDLCVRFCPVGALALDTMSAARTPTAAART
jgi:NAD-dependent dihydropyrimidine dehydrogenase PreA subunit